MIMNGNGDHASANSIVQPLLTDLYQITMSYAYWKTGKVNDIAVFDLFFRKNPFRGEFTIFCGLEECVKFLQNFRFSKSDISYLRQSMPNVEEDFWLYLSQLDASKVSLSAVPEGYVVFPKVPLIRVEGPLPVVQLVETTLLNLVNYASLVATNAARFRICAGSDVKLLEFGLRRAQGPDGGLSASKYCYIGGFDGTSNVLAGKMYGIPISGTHAHSFVNSFKSFDELPNSELEPQPPAKRPGTDFITLVKQWLEKVAPVLRISEKETHQGELAAFVAYALAFPSTCLCLLDTYSVLRSGLPNFLAVALALNQYGYRAIGIRLDSGDLAYLSRKCRDAFHKVADEYSVDWMRDLMIVASNDINEDTLRSLKEQESICVFTMECMFAHNRLRAWRLPEWYIRKNIDSPMNLKHQIDSFGIGTHLVTCQKQPALGCVFKLVALNGEPRMKLSEEVGKINLPGKKNAYRLYSEDDQAVLDLVQLSTEPAPKVGGKILVRHPFVESKRAYVCPCKVEPLYQEYWGANGVSQQFATLQELKKRTAWCLKRLRPDIKRELNPTPYKVSVTDEMYHFLHDLWLKNAPIGELS